MTPITSSNLRSSSPHRNRAGCALTALPCAAVYYPTVLRFDVAIGQRPSARFEGDAAKHHTNQVLPPLPRRLRLLPSAAAVSAFTKKFFIPCDPLRGGTHRPRFPASAVPTSSQHYRIAASSTSLDVGGGWYPKGFITSIDRARHSMEVYRLTVTSEVTPLAPRAPRALQIHHTLPLDHPRAMHRRRWSYPSDGAMDEIKCNPNLSLKLIDCSGKHPTETRKAAETRLHKPDLPTTTRSNRKSEPRFAHSWPAQQFARENPGMPPLPVSYNEREEYKGRGGVHSIVSVYARSLVAQNYDVGRHPSFERYACGVLASPLAPGFVTQDEELRRRFPPRPLDGLGSGLYWDPPKSPGQRKRDPAE